MAIKEFHCPACGGGIDYDGQSVTMRCPYCNTSVVVPESLRPTPSPAPRPLVEEVGERRRTPTVIQVSTTTTQRSNVNPNTVKTMAGCGIVGIVMAIAIPFVVVAGVFALVWFSASSEISEITEMPSFNPLADITPRFATLNTAFGSEGTGAGSFEQARDGAMDGEGRICISDYSTPRIQVFENDGTFVTQWMVEASNIQSIAVSPEGTVYAVYGGQIHIFNGDDGTDLGVVTPSGSAIGSGTPDSPYYDEVFVTADEGLIALAEDTIYRFDRNMRLTLEIPDAIETITDSSQTGLDIVEDGIGNIFIASQRENSIFKFNKNGTFQQRIGRDGDGEGEFLGFIMGLGIDRQGRLYTADFNGIQVFDSTTGTWITQIDDVESSLSLYDVDVSPDNELLVVSTTRIFTFALPEE